MLTFFFYQIIVLDAKYSELSEQDKSHYEDLIQQEVEQFDLSKEHEDLESLIPLFKTPEIPPETEAWISRKAQETNNGDTEFTTQEGIDLSRYDIDAFDNGKDSEISDEQLKNYCVSLVYLQDGLENLKLLEQYGKNQWLLANDSLEQSLQNLQQAVREERAKVSLAKLQKKELEQSAQSSVEYLNNRWTEGIRNVIEVGIANLEMKIKIQDKRSTV